MKLIGINGFKRSGKGTVFDGVREFRFTSNYRAEGKGFADKLKQYAALTLGYTGTPEELFQIGDALKLDGVRIAVERYSDTFNLDSVDSITGRQYLQNVGNEARELFGEWFWVDQVTPFGPQALARVWELPQTPGTPRLPDAACITDLRYENEAQRIRAIGGIVIEVTRPGTESDGHASEQRLPRNLVDYTLANDGSIHDLYEKTWDVLSDLHDNAKGDAFNL
jgi:hypothetical protein